MRLKDYIKFSGYPLLLILAAGLLPGCGGDSIPDWSISQSSVQKTTSITLRGGATSGMVKSAHVDAHQWQQGEWHALGYTTTDEQGMFSLDATSHGTPIKITMTTSPESSMTCNAFPECEPGVSFGMEFVPPIGSEMVVIITGEAASLPISISPVTHISANWILGFPVISNDSVTVANRRLGHQFGLSSGYISHSPVNITQPVSLDSADANQIQHALVSAAIASHAAPGEQHLVSNQLSRTFLEEDARLPAMTLSALSESILAMSTHINDDDINNYAAILITRIGHRAYWPDAMTLQGSWENKTGSASGKLLSDGHQQLSLAGIDRGGYFLSNHILNNTGVSTTDWREHRQLPFYALAASMLTTVISDAVQEDPELADSFNVENLQIEYDKHPYPEFSMTSSYQDHSISAHARSHSIIYGAEVGYFEFDMQAFMTSETVSTDYMGFLSVDVVSPDLEDYVRFSLYPIIALPEGKEPLTREELASMGREIFDSLEASARFAGESDITFTGIMNKLSTAIDMDVDINVPGYLLGGNMFDFSANELNLDLPNGDYLRNIPGKPFIQGGMGSDIDAQVALLLKVGNMDELAIEGTIRSQQNPSLAQVLYDSVRATDDSEQLENVLPQLMTASEMDLRVSNAVGSIDYQLLISPDSQGLQIRTGGNTILTYYAMTKGPGMIFDGDTLVGIISRHSSLVGKTLSLANGENRHYLLGHGQDINPDSPLQTLVNIISILH